MNVCWCKRILVFIFIVNDILEFDGRNTNMFAEYIPLRDYISMASVLGMYNDNILECGRQCLKLTECQSFFYKQRNGECILSSKRTPLRLQHIKGWKYYMPKRKTVECPADYVYHTDMDMCYLYAPITANYTVAAEYCSSKDARLMFIDSEKKQYSIENILAKRLLSSSDRQRYWIYINGIYNGTAGTWFTDFGKEMTYFHWYHTEPSKLPTNIYIRFIRENDFQWKTVVPFHRKRDFMCEAI